MGQSLVRLALRLQDPGGTKHRVLEVVPASLAKWREPVVVRIAGKELATVQLGEPREAP